MVDGGAEMREGGVSADGQCKDHSARVDLDI